MKHLLLHTNNKGFTVYFAVLVASLALAVGIAIFDLLQRELALSQVVAQSQYAIYAADTGAECALYWDSKAPLLNGVPSIFGTSSTSSWGSSAPCAGTDITSSWDHTQASSTGAVTTFTLSFSGQPYCAEVDVGKYTTSAQNPPRTTVTSHGYNTCATNGTERLERALEIHY